MKIALLTYSTKPRGSVVHTWELATALTDLGHQVCIMALAKDDQGIDRPLPCALELIPAQPAPADTDALIQQRISEFIKGLVRHRTRYDIYHAQDCLGANALLHLRDTGTIPHVVRTVHHIENYSSPYLQACQDTSIRLPDLRLCVSDRWQQILNRDYGIDAPRVVNGVDQRRFSSVATGQEAALKTAYGLTGRPLYLTVGGIEPRKNSLMLLAAFAQVRQTQPTAQLIIAGGATLFDYQAYREQFFTQVKQLGLDSGTALVLPGVVSDADLPVLYRCADVFCFPSVKEGWGLVVLEAIAAGLPVVTSNHPPFTEFLAPSQARLVPPNSVDALAAAMVAASDPARSRSLVAASQAILAEYTWARSAQLHGTHYQQLLHTSAPHPLP